MSAETPAHLSQVCRGMPERIAWLEQLPRAIREMTGRWSLRLGAPFEGPDVSCAWVAPATRSDGTAAVLKLGMPHMEGRDEIAGLRFWNGEPTILLLAFDEEHNAMLLERCEPGTSLRGRPLTEQDEVIAGLLKRLWRRPGTTHRFRALGEMLKLWSAEVVSGRPGAIDPGLVREAMRLLEELPRSAEEPVLLATDLHAANVLRARRKPWLVIDPKPFVGDPAYDATQHLLNAPARLLHDPDRTIGRFAAILDVDAERVRLWTFARLALMACTDTRSRGAGDSYGVLARRLLG